MSEVIEQLYKKYLEITEKERKLDSIKQLGFQLVQSGIAKDYYDIEFNEYTGVAKAYAYPSKQYIDKIEELETYLGAMRSHIVITSSELEEKDPEKMIKIAEHWWKDEKIAEFIKRAVKLGLKVTEIEYHDYTIVVAYVEIARNKYATAYLVFEQESWSTDP